MDQKFIIAFSISLLAGLSTGIGSMIALFAKKQNYTMLSVGLGFSGGVMVYVSFMDIMPASVKLLQASMGVNGARWAVLAAFFGGLVLTALIDALVPSYSNPHQPREHHDLMVVASDKGKVKDLQEIGKKSDSDKKLMRTGLFVAAAITLHNFPEGIATFMSSYVDLKLGIPIAIAIAIHNIPEGISVSVPIFYATGNRKKAFLFSFLSGLAEPLAALIAFFFLRSFLNPVVLAVAMTLIAGIMIYIAFDELLPTAREYGKGHLAIIGVIAGMLFMAVSLNLM